VGAEGAQGAGAGAGAHRILERAERELHAGRIWRTKEILRGAIGGGHCDALILERYGQLLETLGERFEAGRYLFASGARQPQYEAAIHLFLERHARATPKQFVSQLPACIRRRALEQLPPRLQQELRDRGAHTYFPAAIDDDASTCTAASVRRSKWRDRAAALFTVAVTVLFVASLIVGVATILNWVAGLFQ